MIGLDEVRATLTRVVGDLEQARAQLRTAQAGIEEATALLERLSAQHPTSLVPPQLVRAGTELERGTALVAAGTGVVAAIAARL